MNRYRHISTTLRTTLTAFAMLGLAACGTQRTVVAPTTDPAPSTTFSTEQFFRKVESNRSYEQALTAKVKVTVDAAGKSLSTSGQLKMKRGDVIQLSLVDPILGAVELGRMEFTPNRVLIIDRINKQYIDVPYSEVGFLKKANVDFNTLQSLFWNQVFVPGQTTSEVSDFTISKATGGTVDIAYSDRMLDYHFSTALQTGILTRTTITNNRDADGRFSFDYDKFSDFQGTQFPRSMVMSFVMSGQTSSLTLSLSSLKNTTEWLTQTSVPSKYIKADPEKIFKMLVQ